MRGRDFVICSSCLTVRQIAEKIKFYGDIVMKILLSVSRQSGQGQKHAIRPNQRKGR